MLDWTKHWTKNPSQPEGWDGFASSKLEWEEW